MTWQPLKQRLRRRAFLRGAASTVIGLPLLDMMLNENGTAYADGSSLPCRFFIFYAPTSLKATRVADDEIVPQRTGFGYDIRPGMQSLAARNLQGDVSVISGLYVPNGRVPGGYEEDYHQHAQNAVITGAMTGFSGGYAEPQGVSADQLVANAITGATRFDSLVYQIDPSRAGRGSAVEARNGRFRAIEQQTSPAQAYRSLFDGFTPPTSTPTTPSDDLETRLRISSLSYASEEIRALQGLVGRSDRQRLEAHFEEIRELENRLRSLTGTPSSSVGSACSVLSTPSDPPNTSRNIPDQTARADLFIELTRMAFACDLTRSIHLAAAEDLGQDGMRNDVWNNEGVHNVQHGNPQPDLNVANRWFIEQYAKVLEGLKGTSEGPASVLDRTAAVFVMHGGGGGRTYSQDRNHSTDNMMMLLGGRAGGLDPGQHVVARDEHTAAVFNTAVRAVGVDRTLGDISTTIDALVG